MVDIPPMGTMYGGLLFCRLSSFSGDVVATIIGIIFDGVVGAGLTGGGGGEPGVGGGGMFGW